MTAKSALWHTLAYIGMPYITDYTVIASTPIMNGTLITISLWDGDIINEFGINCL